MTQKKPAAEVIQVAAIAPYRIYPAKMGGQKGIADFYQWLSPLLPVTVISTSDNVFPTDHAATFVPMLGTSRMRYANLALFFRLKNFFIRKKITHLIIEHPYYGWLGLMLKKACGVKLIVHSHNIEALRFKSVGKSWWKLLWQYEKFVHRNADLNFFISDEDRAYAVNNFGLNPARCATITYGFDRDRPADDEERKKSRAFLNQTYKIKPEQKILLFNGTLDYPPNLDAVRMIRDEINPRLQKSEPDHFRIIICGKNLPSEFLESKSPDKNLIYAGFVDDISVYFKGADIFLNPVCDGGGIKTKLVEAIGYGVSAVSTATGAIGVDKTVAGAKLKIVADADWDGFCRAISETTGNEETPASFYQHFYWGNICAKASQIITSGVA